MVKSPFFRKCNRALYISKLIVILSVQTVKLLLNTDCKCHGVSGSCTMKTCWHSLPPFREVGKALMRKYWKARGVAASTAPASGGNHRTTGKRSSKRLRLKLRSARSSATAAVDEPKITELVYLEQSPNYCDRDFGAGSLGTYGRFCNRTSDGNGLLLS